MNALGWGARLIIAASLLTLAGVAGAQEDLDKGKSAAQLFASDCALCHKSPQGLARSGGLLGLESFLREHYTASRESAKAIANYIKAMDTGPARPVKRAAKGEEKAKAGEKKKLEAEPATAKPDEAKSSDIMAPEPKAGDAARSKPAAAAKPAEGRKSKKSDKPE